MEKQVPLSKWAVHESAEVKSVIISVFSTFILVFGIMGGCFLTSNSLILGTVFLALTALLIFLMVRLWRWNKKSMIEANNRDYALAERIRSAIEFLSNHPPDLTKAESADLQEVTNIKPIRIEYFPQQALEGELAGTFKGTWAGLIFFGTMKGEIFGSLVGESTPELTDQNMLLICQTEEGDSLRLICPSIHVLTKNLRSYLINLAREYGAESHSYNALQDFWQGPNGLREILSRLNPQRIYDYLVTKLELPLEQRPDISAKGIQFKEGSLLVSLISCEGKTPEAVIPLDFINKMRSLLEEKLKRELPPIYLLENKKAS